MDQKTFTNDEINARIVGHHQNRLYRVLPRAAAEEMLDHGVHPSTPGAFVVCAVYPAWNHKGRFYLSSEVVMDGEGAAIYGVCNKLNQMSDALASAHHSAEEYRALAYGHKPFLRELDDLRAWKSSMQSQVYDAVLQWVDKHDLDAAKDLDALRERAYQGQLSEADRARVQRIVWDEEKLNDREECDDALLEHIRDERCGERMDYDALLYLAALCDWEDGPAPVPPVVQERNHYRKVLTRIARGKSAARGIAAKALDFASRPLAHEAKKADG